MPSFPTKTATTLAAIVLFGTIYSVLNGTYLDTSNPLLSHLPHPLHRTHYFAAKGNPLNVLFIKKAWAWTTAAFFFHYFTSPASLQTKDRLYKFFAATASWLIFTGWFFGPSLFERFILSTGGECVLVLPDGNPVTIPENFCHTGSALSPRTHPSLFSTHNLLIEDNWRAVPRLRRGHDVSGHIFLVTLSVLFLVDQLSFSFSRPANRSDEELKWSYYHYWAVFFNVLVVALGVLASYTTSVYFHTPPEKFTGFLLGLASYAITRLSIFEPEDTSMVIHPEL